MARFIAETKTIFLGTRILLGMVFFLVFGLLSPGTAMADHCADHPDRALVDKQYPGLCDAHTQKEKLAYDCQEAARQIARYKMCTPEFIRDDGTTGQDSPEGIVGSLTGYYTKLPMGFYCKKSGKPQMYCGRHVPEKIAKHIQRRAIEKARKEQK